MCGIWAILGADYSTAEHAAEFMKIAGRGPDFTIVSQYREGQGRAEFQTPPLWFGFHRLAIVQPGDQESSQPIVLKNTQTTGGVNSPHLSVICNGEIYNHLAIKSRSPIQKAATLENGGSDCAAILHSFVMHMGDLSACCSSLDGVFAFLMSDGRNLYVGRDPLGVRPLFYGRTLNGAMVFGSEMKAIEKLCVRVDYFPPGCCAQIAIDNQPTSTAFFSFRMHMQRYFHLPSLVDTQLAGQGASDAIRALLITAVEKRLMGNRLFGFMLSGGLDSSLIASIASKFLRNPKNANPAAGFPTPIAFSVGFADSPDLEQARHVARYLDIPHRVLVIRPDECIDIVPKVIYAMETFDPLLIRCGIPHFLLCRHIARTSEVKVLLSGEGADELFGSYDYMQNAPSADHLHGEILRRLRRLHQYDVLRCDRATSCHGLEIRVPFLDKRIVEFVASMSPSLKLAAGQAEKHVLRAAFKGWLPEEVLWRRKEGFSEALGRQDLGQLLTEYAETTVSDRKFASRHRQFPWRTPATKEEFWYRSLFERMFERQRVYSTIHTKVYWTAAWHRTVRKTHEEQASWDEEDSQAGSDIDLVDEKENFFDMLMIDVGGEYANGQGEALGGSYGSIESGSNGATSNNSLLLEPIELHFRRNAQYHHPREGSMPAKLISSSVA